MTGSIRESRWQQRSKPTRVGEELKGAGESEELGVQVEERAVADADAEVGVAAEQTERLFVFRRIGEAHRQVLNAQIQGVLLAEECLQAFRELSRLALATPLGRMWTRPVDLEQTHQVEQRGGDLHLKSQNVR